MRASIPSVAAAALAALALAAACGDPASSTEPPDTPAADGDVLAALQAIPGMTASELGTDLPGYRFFELGYEQPVDHAHPEGAHFVQRMTLLHRDAAAPMVVYNSGYFVSPFPLRSEVTAIVGGNQLSMEHRFFAPSRPDPADWTKLDIAEAAADQHRIVEALRPLYHGRWLTTGASKGGMTSLFHRRFYPDDVDGTIAYVAPLDYPADEVQGPDNRYIRFLDQVGTDPACRQHLEEFQNLALAHRDALEARMQADASFTAILGVDRAFEFAVEELPFIFWQYGSQADCASIPAAGAADSQLYQFLDGVVTLSSYGDSDLTDFLPYYHQSATQLGYPIDDESYLVGLRHPGEDTARAYVPAGIPTPPYDDGAAMTDVQGWIATQGAHLLLIYGERDPWSAGAVTLGDATDSFEYVAPGGNHGSSIRTLAPADAAAATATVMRWAGLGARVDGPPVVDEETAEQADLAAERRHRR
ncbi:MAG TPA: S28 family serine protease [Kofleriaceae bacterium]|nr:S28 family serine protease [Kofleriaceae bacterium]